MKSKIILLASLVLCALSLQAQSIQLARPQLYQTDGFFYRDRQQYELYTGDYREYYENGTLKLEMQIRDGLPEGPYIVYFENRRPQEIRSYKGGKLHGLWRSYDISGQITSEAGYKNGQSMELGAFGMSLEVYVMRCSMRMAIGEVFGVCGMIKGNLWMRKLIDSPLVVTKT